MPQGYGKTSMAQALADMLGCIAVVDEWTPQDTLTLGALHLTSEMPAEEANAEAAQRAAFHAAGCMIDGVERTDGGAA